MRRLMGINRNSYSSYQRRQKNRPEDPENQENLAWIRKVAEGSQYAHAGRRMRNALNPLDYPIGIKKNANERGRRFCSLMLRTLF